MTQLEKYYESKKHPEFKYWNQVLLGSAIVSALLVYLVGSGLPR